MNVVTFILVSLILVYTFYIYRENLVLKSKLELLTDYGVKQDRQVQDLLNVYKQRNDESDIFIETIGFNAKNALEHKSKREMEEFTNSELANTDTEQINEISELEVEPKIGDSLLPVPTGYEAMLI